MLKNSLKTSKFVCTSASIGNWFLSTYKKFPKPQYIFERFKNISGEERHRKQEFCFKRYKNISEEEKPKLVEYINIYSITLLYKTKIKFQFYSYKSR